MRTIAFGARSVFEGVQEGHGLRHAVGAAGLYCAAHVADGGRRVRSVLVRQPMVVCCEKTSAGQAPRSGSRVPEPRYQWASIENPDDHDEVGTSSNGGCDHDQGQTPRLDSIKACYLHPTVEVRCSSTAPAMAAPSEVDVPLPSSSSAT